MEGMKAILEGNTALFEAKMQQAIDLEDLTNYPTGPPRITKPSFEQYGEWLLENKRYEEARVQFDKALLRMPKRAKSLKGKLIALQALNKTEESTGIQNELQAIYAQADPEVKAFLDD